MEHLDDPVSGFSFTKICTLTFRSEHLHLIPRSLPSYSLPQPYPPLELNALGYAGMMLVRSSEQEAALMQAAEPQGGLMSVLARCGVPREFGEQVLEAEAAFHGQIEQEMSSGQ